MKRELKVILCSKAAWFISPTHKANPYEKGTESLQCTDYEIAYAILTKLIPMKRELKV